MQVTVKRNTGPMGYADVRKLKSGVRVTFKDTGDAYEVEDFSQLPDNFVNGEYNVTLSSDGNKIYGLRPTAGSYIMSIKELGNKGAGVPDTKIQRGRPVTLDNGQRFVIPDQLVWAVILEVKAEGHRFDGLTIFHQLPYLFTNVPGTQSTMLSGTKNQIARLETFLRVAGMDVASVEIPFGPAPSILTFIEEYFAQHAQPFFGSVTEKGFIKDVSALPVALSTPAPKKRAKKS